MIDNFELEVTRVYHGDYGCGTIIDDDIECELVIVRFDDFNCRGCELDELEYENSNYDDWEDDEDYEITDYTVSVQENRKAVAINKDLILLLL
jgi:hypothetical protein